MEVETLAVPTGPDVVRVLPRLAEAIRGGNPVLPVAAAAPPRRLPDHDPADLPEDLAVVVGTSGSTGTPRGVLGTAVAPGGRAPAPPMRDSGDPASGC